MKLHQGWYATNGATHSSRDILRKVLYSLYFFLFLYCNLLVLIFSFSSTCMIVTFLLLCYCYIHSIVILLHSCCCIIATFQPCNPKQYYLQPLLLLHSLEMAWNVAADFRGNTIYMIYRFVFLENLSLLLILFLKPFPYFIESHSVFRLYILQPYNKC